MEIKKGCSSMGREKTIHIGQLHQEVIHMTKDLFTEIAFPFPHHPKLSLMAGGWNIINFSHRSIGWLWRAIWP